MWWRTRRPRGEADRAAGATQARFAAAAQAFAEAPRAGRGRWAKQPALRQTGQTKTWEGTGSRSTAALSNRSSRRRGHGIRGVQLTCDCLENPGVLVMLSSDRVSW